MFQLINKSISLTIMNTIASILKSLRWVSSESGQEMTLYDAWKKEAEENIKAIEHNVLPPADSEDYKLYNVEEAYVQFEARLSEIDNLHDTISNNPSLVESIRKSTKHFRSSNITNSILRRRLQSQIEVLKSI